jgi:hypothetical protein
MYPGFVGFTRGFRRVCRREKFVFWRRKIGLLDGNIAFITGGGSGVGKGTARRFAAEDAVG